MDIYKKDRKGSYQECITQLPPKKGLNTYQKYYNRSYMKEIVHDLTTRVRQRKKQSNQPVKMKLRGIVVLKQSDIMSCIISFIQINPSFVETGKEFLMRG